VYRPAGANRPLANGDLSNSAVKWHRQAATVVPFDGVKLPTVLLKNFGSMIDFCLFISQTSNAITDAPIMEQHLCKQYKSKLIEGSSEKAFPATLISIKPGPHC
jgi:hypothetical protein